MRFIVHILMAAVLSFSLVSFPAFALKTDQNQLITVESEEQSADLQTNLLIFSGEVIAKQGSIKLQADKVEVARNQDGTLKSIQAFGEPATFEQQQDNGRYIRSRAKIIKYFPAATQLVLLGNALVYQGESKIEGAMIEYNLNTQKMKAKSYSGSMGGKVSSTFAPNDFK